MSDSNSGKIHSKETKEKLSKIQKEKMKNPEVRKNLSEKAKEQWKDNDELRKFHSEQKREMCNNGHAIYMRSFINTISKPQIELYELVLDLYSAARLEYPIHKLNRSIDIAILEHKIAIEYDGSYWHQNEKADKQRQKEIEELGWRFIRYRDYIPTLENLQHDIKEVI